MMRKISFDKIIFCLACVCVFLPWFTWNARVMGYCWGFDFILELAVPLFVIAFFLFSDSRNKILIIVTELCSVLLLVFTVLAIGMWQKYFFMASSWKFDIEPVMPTYWISLSVYILLFSAVQFRAFPKKR